MKRLIRSLFAIVCLLGVCLSAQAAGSRFFRAGAAGSAAGQAAVRQQVAVDTDYLDYYGLGNFRTHLPVVYIDTEGRQIEKENKVWATAGILNADPDLGLRSVLEGPDEVKDITIKMRGASSYAAFDKKQYRLKFYRKQGGNKSEDYSFLGMEAHSEWVLNGPYLDKTLLRNRLLYQLAGEIFEWAPDTRYCEVFLNGRYQGVYLAIEPVTTGANRLDLAEFGLLSGQTAYLLKRDRAGTEGEPLETYGSTHGKTRNSLYAEYPSEKKITDAQRNWITQDISRFERCLYGGDGGRPLAAYQQYIDLDNFADYFIFNEVCQNYDAGNLSTYVYKDLQGELKLTVWDYNNAFDNFQEFALQPDKWLLTDNSWFDYLIRDKDFVDRVQERYAQLRQGPLNEAHIYGLMEQYQEELGDAVGRNFAIWGYTFERTLTNDSARNIYSYEEAIAQLKEAVHARFEFMDQHLTSLYQWCGTDEDGL